MLWHYSYLNQGGKEKNMDINSFIKEIAMRVTENNDNFMFETIRPYCEEVTQRVIDKKTLVRALTKDLGKTVKHMGRCPNCESEWHLSPQYVRGLDEIYCYRCGMKIILRSRNDS